MQIERIVVGALQENCYIVSKNNKAILIDPGDEAEKIDKCICEKEIVSILITHNHFDHTGALSYFEEKYHLKHNVLPKDFSIEIINTPGHTKDSKTFYFKEEQVMFTGDFLFKGAIGRMDLPGGNEEEMQNSLKLISAYDDTICIFPGHGESSVLGEEKKNFSYYF